MKIVHMSNNMANLNTNVNSKKIFGNFFFLLLREYQGMPYERYWQNKPGRTLFFFLALVFSKEKNFWIKQLPIKRKGLVSKKKNFFAACSTSMVHKLTKLQKCFSCNEMANESVFFFWKPISRITECFYFQQFHFYWYTRFKLVPNTLLQLFKHRIWIWNQLYLWILVLLLFLFVVWVCTQKAHIERFKYSFVPYTNINSKKNIKHENKKHKFQKTFIFCKGKQLVRFYILYRCMPHSNTKNKPVSQFVNPFLKTGLIN